MQAFGYVFVERRRCLFGLLQMSRLVRGLGLLAYLENFFTMRVETRASWENKSK